VKSQSTTEIQAKFKWALDSFCSKLNKDEQVIAVILMGSLSYDQVWEKSDIDLKLIVKEQKLAKSTMSLIAHDVLINATIDTRNDFKRWMEGSVQGSIDHAILVKSKLLFTKDPSLQQYFDDIGYVGERDRQLMLLQSGCRALNLLSKVEKWCYVKADPTYSAFWMLKMVDTLADIEVMVNQEVPMRESVQRALQYHPELFHAIYTEMICGKVDERKVRSGLVKINAYLNRQTERLFKPVLDYLRQEQEIRTISDIEARFETIVSLDFGWLTLACDWLAECGALIKVTAETKLTPRSNVQLEEPAYLCADGGQFI
jgi:hypothetical protein